MEKRLFKFVQQLHVFCSDEHRWQSEFESVGADWNVRGCRHKNAKI